MSEISAPPRFIYFDLGNVLLAFSHEQAARQMAAVAGCSYETAWEAVFGSHALEIAYESGEISSAQFHARFCELTNTQPVYSELMQAGSAIFSPILATHEIAIQLRSAGFRLGVLSNTCEAHWNYCLAQYPFISSLFSVHCLSFQVGCMKPEKSIYEAAVTMAGERAESIFFIDDRPENVHAAREHGMLATLFHSSQQLTKELMDRQLLKLI